MSTETKPLGKVRQGCDVKRWREIWEIRQELIAFDLNRSWQALPKIEQKKVGNGELLDRIVWSLQVPVVSVKHMNEEETYNGINMFRDSKDFTGFVLNNFNLLEKVLEFYGRMLGFDRVRCLA